MHAAVGHDRSRVGVITRRGRAQLLLVVSLFCLVPSTAAQPSQPLPCVPAAATDTTPWVTRARVLASFPPDAPVPRFLGGFGDAHARYELHLWQDAAGIFGQLLAPVLDADSPTSRLYAVLRDAQTGALRFDVRFPDGDGQFKGTLHGGSVTGTLERAGGKEVLVLKKLPRERVHGAGADAYGSRAQFECAMTLFGRR